MNSAIVERPKADELPSVSGGAALLHGHYAPPPADEDGKSWVRTSVIVQAPPRKLYEMWRDLEAVPKWYERVVEVRRTGETTSHWVMRDEPGDNVIEWNSEILADVPEKRIAWRTTSGDPESAGEVIFEPAPGNRGTMVTVLQQFRIGKLARAWEAITGRDPKQGVIESLRHFKALAETGEIPRVKPQPHGNRGLAGEMKKSLYSEKITVPPGNSRATVTVAEGRD